MMGQTVDASSKPHKRPAVWLTSKSLLMRFFTSYMWLGVTLILVSIVTSQLAAPPQSIWVRIAIDLMSAVGIAILVAAIFTFAVGTTDFLNLIRDLLQSIIVNRNFLTNMDERAKKEVLREILRPTDQQRDIYGNIESYYSHYIDRSMRVSDISVRSNYTASCYVFYNKDDDRLVCEYTNNYRVYPSPKGYDDITVGFYGEDGALVTYESVMLFFPDGKTRRLNKEEIESLEASPGVGTGDEFRTIDMSQYSAYAHIDVEFRILEKGQDHWIQIGFQALQPTDGFRFSVHCEDPLVIKEETTFIYGATRVKDPPNMVGCGRGTISCQQWIDEGGGTTVVVAAPHKIGDDVRKNLAERSHAKRDETLPHGWRASSGKTRDMSRDREPVLTKPDADRGDVETALGDTGETAGSAPKKSR